MKEGVTLFCPKCGNPVSKDDNFCASCGNNLKDVKINITPNKKSFEDTHKVKKVSEHTRVFNPRSLDAIDTTDELKNIIDEVDRKISKNIKDYENKNLQSKSANNKDKKINKTEEKTSEIAKKDKKDKLNKNQIKNLDKIDDKKIDNDFFDEINEDTSSNKMSQKELVRRVQEELKKSNFDKENNNSSNSINSSKVPSDDLFEDSKNKNSDNSSSKKFSLKEKWNNFIREDDDEYSIFADLKDDTKKKEDTRNLEISKSVEDTDRSFENTLSTPKIDIENAIKKSEGEKKKSNNNSKIFNVNSKEKSDINNLNDSKINNEKNKTSINDANREAKINKSFDENDKTKDIKYPEKEKSDKKKNLKELFSFKDKGEKPVKDKEKVTSDVEKRVENKLSDKINKKEAKFSSHEGIDKLLVSLEKITDKFSDYIGYFGSKESKIIIGLGTLLNAIMLLIGSGTFKLILILFLLLKLAFDYFEFYIPLNIATERDNIDTSYPEVRKFALINWIICKIVLFIGFIISPFGGFFKYNMLQALTAMPLATLILIALSLLIAISLYKDNFIAKSKINFIGWYAIAFTLFELLFKMIWFIINFIFVTLFW